MGIFARCPAYKERFGVKRLDRKLVKSERDTETIMRPVAASSANVKGASRVVEVQEVISFTKKEFEETYRCSKCGHQWSVEVDKVSR
jgi:rubrerythrin